MEQLKHFSHVHPLILNVEDHAQEDVNCCGCNKSILIGESAYSCSTSSHTSDNTTHGDCDNFFLHKTCAELPRELEYPMHQDHSLTLHSRPQYRSRCCNCNVCCVKGWKWFTYQCLSCQFDVCLTCASQDRSFYHESHNHPLTLMPKEALFICDACHTEDKDFSYFCTTCLFWLHKSCASTTTTLKCQFHEDHPLVLAYSLPEQYRTFWQGCSICNRIIFTSYWIYYCEDCRFFAHIKCATSTKSAEPLTLSENEMEQLKDFSHEHPLILNVEDHALEDVICCGCNKSILIGESAYSCSTRSHTSDNSTQVHCDNIFLHKICAELPQELEYPMHQDHPLTLHSRPQYPSQSCVCNVCSVNGWKWFTYQCASCEFDVCLTCALQDRSFHHESHNHPLTLMPREALFSCDACGIKAEDLSYFCNTCLFWLHKSCASATTTLKCQFHEDHPLFLAYSLPEQYRTFGQNCSICNRKLFPGYWIYYCADCRFFAHIKCATSTKTAEPLTLSENEMEQLKHFSHEHPLILNVEDHAQEDVICCGCNKSILIGESAYSCSTSSNTSDCDNFFLHKTCAELPQELEYPMHQDHPLTLLSLQQYDGRTCFCDVCCVKGWKWFTYRCVSCNFHVCLTCVLQDRSFHHESHNHPLTVMPKEALFSCDACRTEDKDLSYFCNTCLFWLHKSCASATTILKCQFHEDHPLVLAYSLPEQYRSFMQDCSICNRIIFPSYWIYYCEDCRFFAHIKCATSTKTASKNENIYEADDENLMHFPMPDEATLGSLICQFVKEICLTDDTSTPTNDYINHWAHKDHPLILFHEFKRNNNEMKNEVMLCDGCVQPLTDDTFYGCLQCKYFLHKYCAELPKELQHLSHPEHKLVANQYPARRHFFKCDFCQKYGNGIFYYCELCNFYIDIVCASLPNKIKHEVDKHPLKQLKLSKCSASEYQYSGFGFGCETCNFYLRKSRAIMPRTVRHRWDPHPLRLMYPPVKDHPHEFDCEVCSKYINPNYWFYHCRDCDMSFHIECLLRDDIYSNIKFGATVKIDHLHPHHLTFVQNKRKIALYGSRGTGYIDIGEPVLECAPCKFVICTFCRNNL